MSANEGQKKPSDGATSGSMVVTENLPSVALDLMQDRATTAHTVRHPISDATTEYENLVFLDLEQNGDSTIRPADNPATLNPPRPTPPEEAGS